MTVAEYNLCVEKFADSIYRFTLKNLKNADRSKDIVQDTFEKMWVKHGEVQYEKAKSYLFTTAYHTMIDLIRKEKKMVEMDTQAMESPSIEGQYSDIKEVLDVAVDQLPEDQRSVLLLRDYEGYSYKEIEKITGLSESQVKVYIYRARKTMADYLGSIETII